MEKEHEKIIGLEDNLMNRTLVKEIDSLQFAIYRLLKTAYPNISGYDASLKEHEDGEHITTKFHAIVGEE